MLRRVAHRADSVPWARRLKRALVEAPVLSSIVAGLDRRRLRRLDRDGDIRERSKSRWRDTPPASGLTWGEELSGAPVVDVARSYGAFGADRTVLEVGPGYGRVLRSCIEQGVDFHRYLGLDISAQNVAHLKQSFSDPRVEFLHGDAETVSLSRPVDTVLSFLTFKHLYPSFERALANLGSQLHRGGLALFDLIEGSRTHFQRDHATFLREYARPEVAEIVSAAGLAVEAFDEIEHAPGRGRLLVVARNPER